jgi:uncharacterized protein YceK
MQEAVDRTMWTARFEEALDLSWNRLLDEWILPCTLDKHTSVTNQVNPLKPNDL